MGRKIVVTSGKGGVGKTTIVAGLSRALATLNYTVCVVDGDVGLNNLDLVMNIESKVVYDLIDCMQAKCRIKQAIIKDTLLDTLYTLPAGKNFPSNVVVSFSEIVEKLASIFDFVLVDSPAGLDDGFSRAVDSCCEAIVVVSPHISSVRDASKTFTALLGKKNIVSSAMVANRIRGDLVASGKMMSHDDIRQLLGVKCLGVIPECDDYNVSSTFEFVCEDKNLINQAFMLLAKNLAKNQNLQLDYISKYTGIIGYFRRKLKGL